MKTISSAGSWTYSDSRDNTKRLHDARLPGGQLKKTIETVTHQKRIERMGREGYRKYMRIKQRKYNPELNAFYGKVYKFTGGIKVYRSKTEEERREIRRIVKETETLGATHPTKEKMNIASFTYPQEHKDRLERDGSTVELAIKARKENKKDGFPYVLEHPYYPGIRKLGYSYNPRSRLGTFNVGCPYKLFSMPYIAVYLEDAALAEATVQETLKEYHVSGEWYEVSRELAIKTIEDYVESLNDRKEQEMD